MTFFKAICVERRWIDWVLRKDLASIGVQLSAEPVEIEHHSGQHLDAWEMWDAEPALSSIVDAIGASAEGGGLQMCDASKAVQIRDGAQILSEQLRESGELLPGQVIQLARIWQESGPSTLLLTCERVLDLRSLSAEELLSVDLNMLLTLTC